MKDILNKPVDKFELKKVLIQYTFGMSEEEVIMYLS